MYVSMYVCEYVCVYAHMYVSYVMYETVCSKYHIQLKL